MDGPVYHRLNLVLRFVLELGALAALFYAGLRVGGRVAGAALGVLAVVVAAAVWGLFASPRARISLPLAGRLAVELAFFGSAAVGLVLAGHPTLGVFLLALAVVNRALIQRRVGDGMDQPTGGTMLLSSTARAAFPGLQTGSKKSCFVARFAAVEAGCEDLRRRLGFVCEPDPASPFALRPRHRSRHEARQPLAFLG